jgi:hypothetical protein
MNKAILFTLRRIDGLEATTPDARTAQAWEETDEILQEWASTAPKDGGFDEVRFSILYDNAHVYKGCLALRFNHTKTTGLLAKRVSSDLAFRAGLRCPASITEEEYEHAHDDLAIDSKLAALNWLEDYTIPEEE